MDDTSAQIEAQYCPPLDPALVSAILLDYDLEKSEELARAKQTLDELKENALVQEALDFDPSGMRSDDVDDIRTESHADTSASLSRETDSTSLTHGLSSLDLDREYGDVDANSSVYEHVGELDQLDEDTKIECLQLMFKEKISRYKIQHTIRKYNGKVEAATDDLLSQAYLIDAGSTPDGDLVISKGIEGFSEEHLHQRGRKGKAKNKRAKYPTERRSSSLPGLHDGNSTAAKALTSSPADTDGPGTRILPQFAPLAIDTDTSWSEVTRKAKSATSSRSPSVDISSSAARRDAYALAKATAYAKASAAHRKAKSDRLMGGAAAYYSQVGREMAALSSSAAADSADVLAAQQSTSNELDLHGVDVLNGVRIAQQKVEEWWDRLGENRVNGRIGAEDRQAGFRIVVGLGRHSEGGRSKLGPAVTKMLKQEGWRVESSGAVITVRGPSKR